MNLQRMKISMKTHQKRMKISQILKTIIQQTQILKIQFLLPKTSRRSQWLRKPMLKRRLQMRIWRQKSQLCQIQLTQTLWK